MTVINIMGMNLEQRTPSVDTSKLGAVVKYEDRANDSRGVIYEVGAMFKIAWLDTPRLSEVPASEVKPKDSGRYGWTFTGEILTIEEAYAARDIALQAREQHKQNNERKLSEREAKTEQGKKLLSELMPAGTKAAIIAEYQEDDCDTQTDYFNVKTTRVVLLGFSGHTRDIFSEMRKVAKASGFEEVQHLTEPNDKQEHREKYSMGRGYYLKDSLTYSTGWTISKQPLGVYGLDNIALAIMEEGGNQLPKTGKPSPKASAKPEQPSTRGALCELRENPDKNGIELIFNAKPSAEIRDNLKSAGFRWHRKGGFWYAKDYESTRELAQELAGSEQPADEQGAEPVAKKPVAKVANGDKLRAMADKMESQIDAKFNSGVSQQNPTARRARIAESMRQDGERLQNIQSVLRGLADDIEAGTLPEFLIKVTSKAVIADILDNAARARSYPENWIWYNSDRMKKAGVMESNSAEVIAKLESYIQPPSPEQIRNKKIAEAERELLGTKIAGFFPTPNPVIDLMLERVAIEPGETILEPSAGKGDIADKVREQYPENELHVIEVNSKLRGILQSKQHEVVGSDFLEDTIRGQYDCILMNPPFEQMADIDHIKRAFGMLNDGGRLVCLMSESPFFRNDKKAVEFREWLDDVGGYAEKLEQGSFKGAESFRQTGVSARMVIIEK